METIWVNGAAIEPDGNVHTLFYEQDPAHPRGFAHVTDRGPAEVAQTPAVQAALDDGRLARAEAPPSG